MERADFGTGQMLDWSLVDHDGLMTPVLVAHFGLIKVQVLRTEVLSDTTHCRVSQLRQAATGAVILDAETTLNTAALPPPVLIGLRDTDIPFGQLLIKAGIPARSVDRQITGLVALQGAERRLCRRHRLVNAQTGQELCAIIETLSPVSVLQSAQAAFAKML